MGEKPILYWPFNSCVIVPSSSLISDDFCEVNALPPDIEEIIIKLLSLQASDSGVRNEFLI